ncbi:MAG: GNAT family N-acetyltransferase [Paludibacterium sp.]|uniref:GNAT family N-acetyltransferase n=1 Tax=Paludibacterium sp. TaxID=1917523 RepID=UPI0025E9A6BE|nr:GNAT family N-acetyltransferase [Paludibacterium sp.]MBV8047225.1 GNAT family N-acetyltransferase [Paludibacterium sp.]
MDIIQLRDKAGFVEHRGNIESLFVECFGDRLSPDVWEWAYLRNPNGAGIASLCYDGTRLVGHYAMIPVRLRSDAGVFNAYQSMTTMVSADYRKEGLFVKLATDTYTQAKSVDVDCVLGFPNAMSTPGFRNKLNWILPEPDYVAVLDRAELMQAADHFKRREGQWHLDLGDTANREWRLSKPGTSCAWDDGLAYKRYEDQLDVLAFDDPAQFERLPQERGISILVPGHVSELRHKMVFEYQFGGFGICRPFDPNLVQRQMGMSDVF